MTKLAKVFEDLQQNARYQGLLSRAQQTFAFKTFLERWYSFYQFIPFFRWLLALFSLITGSAFLAQQCQSFFTSLFELGNRWLTDDSA